MTVKELIEKLRLFDQNLRVVTPGFDESNFEDVGTVELISIIFHDEKETEHTGRHILDKKSEGSIPAVEIDFGGG